MQEHKKLCWNCDGYVHVYELQCPYCGVDVRVKEEAAKAAPEESTENNFGEMPEPPFGELLKDEEFVPTVEEWDAPTLSNAEEGDSENPLASLLLLLPGSLFFLFGLSLFLFSSDGYLVFRFKTKYWFLYLLSSWPLLYLGWRSLFPQPGRNASDTHRDPVNVK